MEFTGERFVPGLSGQIKYEHMHRYAACLELAEGKRVLDIACGEGYGSALLALSAASVVGVDIDPEAVRHAASRYGAVNGVSFRQGGCDAIPLPDDAVDLVVSFETIEHHDRHTEMMHEIRRVLRPGGVLVISSPNKHLYSDVPGFRNPHHVKELYFEDLDALLGATFKEVRYFGQRLAVASQLFPLEGAASSGRAFTSRDEAVTHGLTRQEGPIYFVAVCSDAPLPDLDRFASVLVDANEDLLGQFGEVITHQQKALRDVQAELERVHEEAIARERSAEEDANRAAALSREIEERATADGTHPARVDGLLKHYAGLLAEHVTAVRRIREELGQARDEARAAQRSADAERQAALEYAEQLRAQLDLIQSSDSWRITAPLRRISALGQRGLRAVRNPRLAAVSAGRRTLRMLPLPMSAKIRLRDHFFSRYADAFAHLPTHQEWISRRRLMGGVPSVSPPDEAQPEAALEPIALATSTSPVVSIVIPVYGKVRYTHQCLASIARHGARVPFEVIVVDDCSPDGTRSVMERIEGVRLVVQETNQGFIRSCNRGAELARGEYLLFLNNDVEVLEGWLDELLGSFEMVPRAGLVGAKLLYPDGTLQEAGGIIWNDGSAWNFGRGDDPSRPEYCYLRDVDYCSGACIMVPRALFEEVGRFDELFVPAYGEDSDLAFKVRRAGYRVLMQPLARVVHFEGVTSGTDTTSGVKAYQVENARKLRNKWQSVLASHPAPGHRPEAARDAGARLRVLVLDHCTPEPDKDAGSITARNLMRILVALGAKVTFAPEDNFLFLTGYTADLQREGIECLYHPHVSSMEQYLQTHGDLFDAVLIFRVTVAERQLARVRRLCPRARVIFHASDLHHLRLTREAEVLKSPSTAELARKTRDTELGIVNGADMTIVHSTAERDLLLEALPLARIVVFQWAIPIRGTTVSFAERSGIAFIGGYQHEPNVDAALFFHRDVLPLVRRHIPDVRFLAVGSKPPERLRAIEGDGVVVTGYVKDLEALLDTVRLSVAPLRFGAGIKGKIGTSLACGLPCVATPVATEGMGLSDGAEVLVGDSPEALAERIVSLYTDESLWSRLSAAGLAFTRRTYSFDVALTLIADALSELGLPVDPAKRRDAASAIDGLIAAENRRLAGRAAVRLPLEGFSSKAQLDRHMASPEWAARRGVEHRIAQRRTSEETFYLDGYCAACDSPATFLVDRQSGAAQQEGVWVPNWRERLVCGTCELNNRQRLITRVVREALQAREGSASSVYLTEQVTPIFQFLRARMPGVDWIGSEYLGPARAPGERVDGIRHEDVERLSLADASVDLIISNDVLEHVNEPRAALTEFARVLKSGGRLLLTIPFHWGLEHSIRRARLEGGRVEHLLSPQYHGNPVSADGSLVFTDFGWDVLQDMMAAGLENPRFVTCWSERFGHLGANIGYFEAVRP